MKKNHALTVSLCIRLGLLLEFSCIFRFEVEILKFKFVVLNYGEAVLENAYEVS